MWLSVEFRMLFQVPCTVDTLITLTISSSSRSVKKFYLLCPREETECNATIQISGMSILWFSSMSPYEKLRHFNAVNSCMTCFSITIIVTKVFIEIVRLNFTMLTGVWSIYVVSTCVRNWSYYSGQF